MECGNDLLIAGVDYVANGTVRRLIWNKPYLNILRGVVIRDGRAFTEAKNKSSKQKHFARSAHLNAPLVRDSFAFAYGSRISPFDETTNMASRGPDSHAYVFLPMFCVSDCSQGDGIEDERHGQRAANRPAQEPNRLPLVHFDSSPEMPA
jgi:hypothetical protein